MSACDTSPNDHKACSGKCRQSCSKTPKTWVVAACGGLVSLFEKRGDGSLMILSEKSGAVYPSIDQFREHLVASSESGHFNQLVLVGSENDIAWTVAALPQNIISNIVAEISYPLVPNWFKGDSDLPQLSKALGTLFSA